MDGTNEGIAITFDIIVACSVRFLKQIDKRRMFGGNTLNGFTFWPCEAFNIKLKDSLARWFIYLSWNFYKVIYWFFFFILSVISISFPVKTGTYRRNHVLIDQSDLWFLTSNTKYAANSANFKLRKLFLKKLLVVTIQNGQFKIFQFVNFKALKKPFYKTLAY